MPIANLGLGAFGLTKLQEHYFPGARLEPFLGSNFLVEISGLIVAGFKSVSGLEVTTETKEVWQGGQNDGPRTIPVKSKAGPLVFSQGVFDMDQMWTWYQTVINANPPISTFERRSGTIYLLYRASLPVPVMYWNFKDAFPIKWTGPSFDAASSAVAGTAVTLAHEGVSTPMLLDKANTVESKISGLATKIPKIGQFM